MAQTNKYNENKWLTSTWRALKEYILDELGSVASAYEIILGFPESDDLARLVPDRKIIVNFEIDNIQPDLIGFGEGVVKYTEIAGGMFEPREARRNDLNFDIGIWASDLAGGITSRMDAYERISNMFATPSRREYFRAETNGIQILNFDGGRGLVDKVADVRVFRMVEIELVLRVYSAFLRELEFETTGGVVQQPHLFIDDVEISTLRTSGIKSPAKLGGTH